MLPAASRMRTSTEFRDTMRRGVRAARPTLVLHGRALPQPPSRVGFVVSKAVGGAVERNRVKRRLRHLVTPLLSDAEPVAVVVRALPAAHTSPERLSDDLTSAWRTLSRRLGGGVPAGDESSRGAR